MATKQEDLLEQNKRAALQDAYRRYCFDQLNRKWEWENILGDSPDDDANTISAAGDFPVKTLKNGIYKVRDVEVGGEPIKLQVEKGKITPMIHPKNEKDFDKVYGEVMRGFAVGMGVKKIEIDFSKAKNAKDIQLKNVYKLLLLAEKNNVDVKLGPKIMEKMGMNKSDMSSEDREYLEKCKAQLQVVHDNAKKNEDLQKREAKAVAGANILTLQQNTADLSKSGDLLKQAVAAKDDVDVKSKITSFKKSMEKLESMMGKLETGLFEGKPSEKMYEDYLKAVVEMRGKLEALKLIVNSAKERADAFPAGPDKDSYVKAAKDMQKDFDALQKHAENIEKKIQYVSNVNERAKQHIEQLQGTRNTLEDARYQLVRVMEKDPLPTTASAADKNKAQAERIDALEKFHDALKKSEKLDEDISKDLKDPKLTSESLEKYAKVVIKEKEDDSRKVESNNFIKTTIEGLPDNVDNKQIKDLFKEAQKTEASLETHINAAADKANEFSEQQRRASRTT